MSDIFIDELCEQKRKKNSGRKGKTGERDIVNTLNKRFASFLEENPSFGKFHRCLGSGNRGYQVELAEENKEVFSGDVFCKNFNFVIESKKGYDIDLISAFTGGIKEIDAFLNQVEKDSIRCNKQPLLLWKKNHRPTLAFLKNLVVDFPYKMHYRDWTVVSFDDLLNLPDQFFFQK